MSASLSAVPLKISNSIPQYMDLKSEREFSVLHGNVEFSRSKFTGSNLSSTGVSINCFPPSSDSLIHPIAWKKAKWTLTFNLTNSTVNAITNVMGTADEPLMILRSNPLDRIIQNEELKINTNSFQQTRQPEMADAFHRFSTSVDDKVNEYSLSPNQLDEYYQYDLGTLTNKDPFSAYGGMQIGESRMAFADADYSGVGGKTLPGSATAGGVDIVFTFTVMEPIKISPMYFQPYALTGVKDMQYTVNFSNHERMVCVKTITAGIGNITLKSAKLDEFELHFSYSSPKLLSKIPDSVVYPYQYVDFHSKEATAATTDDDEKELQFNAMPLSGVPRKIIIWVSERTQDLSGFGTANVNLTKTDTSKALITKISLNYGNRPGILSGADAHDLFDISKKNGLSGLTYSQTAKWVGSYLSLNFGEEIPLPEGQAPGVLGNPQLSYTLKYKRIPGSGDRTFQLNTAIIYEGTCTIIKNSSAIKQTSVLSVDDVIESMQNDYDMIYSNRYENNKYGGNPAALLGVLSSALPIAKIIRNVVQKGAPIAKMIADGAEKIGLGEGGAVVVKNQKQKGGRISGGAKINRSQMPLS